MRYRELARARAAVANVDSDFMAAIFSSSAALAFFTGTALRPGVPDESSNIFITFEQHVKISVAPLRVRSICVSWTVRELRFTRPN
jgi:hypothetical protein